MTDFTHRKSWLRRNLIWFVPILAILVFICVVTIKSAGFSDVVTAYSDTALYKDAVQMANSNAEVSQKIGKIEALDKMALLEGNARYSTNKDSVELTVRISGEKARAKMDVSAHKVKGKWQYDLVRVRMKKPAETIEVVK